ncbi:MAG: ribonuclease BN (tRNA processing enzyme) [Paraglaciecola sp.]|jgi:ribonuclease BN (tRNA processing enzyme)
MQLTLFGVHVSIPAPDAQCINYGGNIACVHIKLDDGIDIILHAGRGIRELGQELIQSHNHWDHIQGLPFFAPIYQPKRNIFITPGRTALPENDHILKQMGGRYFPVDYHTLSSNIQIAPQKQDIDHWQLNTATITDNGLYPLYRKETNFRPWVNFAMHGDLMIHDAQYTLADRPGKSGWGHSIAEEAVKLSMACRAKRLALYSHENTDENIAQVQSHCQKLIEIAKANLNLFAGAQGMSLAL